MTENHTLTKYTAAFVDELVRSGTRHAVISPGSRSTPLALLMAEHPDLKIWLQVDERSAAFFALGIAKSKNEPVAIVCTSGTAAANYYPAVIEAKLSRIPLVVLTADRPYELRDSGAPQTIDQVRLFGTYPKWFVDMALPEESGDLLRYSRITASRAVSTAIATPAGPIHVNLPFREPLLPDLSLPSLWEGGREAGKSYTAVISGSRTCSDDDLQSLTKELTSYQKGVIVCGPVNEGASFATELVKLSEKLQFPILADPLSQLRTGSHKKDTIIDAYDAFLRVPAFTSRLKPDVIIRFGAMPVSKALLLYIKNNPTCRQIIIDDGAGWRDPTLTASDFIYASPFDFCSRISSFVKGQKKEAKKWLKTWQDVNSISKEAISQAAVHDKMNEGQAMLEAVSMLPDQASIFVGNSMPIRDLDTFLFNQSKQIRTFANRGANGIDGVVSTALGASLHSEPLVLVIGDLSFFHDLNGLLPAKLYSLNATIIVVNNDGGGIFSFLPQAENKSKHFEQLFGTPIGLHFKHVVEMYGGKFVRATDWNVFRNVYEDSLKTNGLKVIEVVTDRSENVRLHKQIWNQVERTVQAKLSGEIK